ncbi:hypothetical protein Q2T40_08490 [Winogradskyella maritima]|uniref:Lipoprotein n=1 Tax=Winogradskyella maritima TaxID=1517766 RepID=A0ABV8AM71_9FLAO|nr:hypothetical protein [Winogradskyella maritima]
MNKTISYYIILFLTTITIGCSSNEANKIDLEIKDPYKIIHIKPDYCKKYGWEERNFKVKIPNTYKNYEKDTPNKIHYVSVQKETDESSELLEFASASLGLTLSTNLVDGDLNASKSYSMMFNTFRPIIDKYVIEAGMQKLINQFCSYPSIVVYSKKADDEIIINDLPANYSELLIRYQAEDKEVWQQYSYIIVPNPNDLNKSLTASYIKEVYNSNKELSKEKFLESESFKIISNIEFID